MLGHVAEVGADVGQAARAAVGLGVQAPIPIGVIEQPVLGICALHHQDFAQVARFAHTAHLLHQGIEAEIVKGAIAAAGLAGEGYQLGGLLHRSGQRLLANHVLAGLQRVADHGEVQDVGGAYMDSIHGGIFQDLVIVGVGLVDVKLFA